MENICRFLGKYLLNTLVMEATTQTAYVLDVLESFTGWGGIKPDIRVINAGLLKKYAGDLHEDKRDAFMLAQLGISGLARGSYMPLDIIRQLRAVMRELQFIERDLYQDQEPDQAYPDLVGVTHEGFQTRCDLGE